VDGRTNVRRERQADGRKNGKVDADANGTINFDQLYIASSTTATVNILAALQQYHEARVAATTTLNVHVKRAIKSTPLLLTYFLINVKTKRVIH
jgi:hypothetical protein